MRRRWHPRGDSVIALAVLTIGWFLALHLIGIPLPYADFQFFHEPAIRLASEGRPYSFGLSCVDPALAKTFNVYVPGYILVWAALYKVFGAELSIFQLGSAIIHVCSIFAAWRCAVRLPVGERLQPAGPARDHFGSYPRAATWTVWAAAMIYFCMAINPHPQSVGIPLGLTSLAVLFGPPTALRRISAGALLALCLFTSPLVAFVTGSFGFFVLVGARRFDDAMTYAALGAAMSFALFALWTTLDPDGLAAVVRHIGRQLVLVHRLTPDHASAADQIYAAFRNSELHVGRLHRYLRLVPAIALLAIVARLHRPLRKPAIVYLFLLGTVSLITAFDYLQAQATSAIVLVLLLRTILLFPRSTLIAALVTVATTSIAYEQFKSLIAAVIHPTSASYAAAMQELRSSPRLDLVAAPGVYFFSALSQGARMYNYEFCAWAVRLNVIAPQTIVLTPLFYELDRQWLEASYRRVRPLHYVERGHDGKPFPFRTFFPYDAEPIILERR